MSYTSSAWDGPRGLSYRTGDIFSVLDSSWGLSDAGKSFNDIRASSKDFSLRGQPSHKARISYRGPGYPLPKTKKSSDFAHCFAWESSIFIFYLSFYFILFYFCTLGKGSGPPAPWLRPWGRQPRASFTKSWARGEVYEKFSVKGFVVRPTTKSWPVRRNCIIWHRFSSINIYYLVTLSALLIYLFTEGAHTTKFIQTEAERSAEGAKPESYNG